MTFGGGGGEGGASKEWVKIWGMKRKEMLSEHQEYERLVLEHQKQYRVDRWDISPRLKIGRVVLF